MFLAKLECSRHSGSLPPKEFILHLFQGLQLAVFKLGTGSKATLQTLSPFNATNRFPSMASRRRVEVEEVDWGKVFCGGGLSLRSWEESATLCRLGGVLYASPPLQLRWT